MAARAHQNRSLTTVGVEGQSGQGSESLYDMSVRGSETIPEGDIKGVGGGGGVGKKLGTGQSENGGGRGRDSESPGQREVVFSQSTCFIDTQDLDTPQVFDGSEFFD